MEFAQRHAITDVCVLCEDVETSIAFYRDKLGFQLRNRAEGFADFTGAGLTLALWEIDHISRHTGIAATRGPGAHKACIAVQLPSPADVDACYAELSAKGVVFDAAAGRLRVERALLLLRRPRRRAVGALRLARGRPERQGRLRETDHAAGSDPPETRSARADPGRDRLVREGRHRRQRVGGADRRLHHVDLPQRHDDGGARRPGAGDARLGRGARLVEDRHRPEDDHRQALVRRRRRREGDAPRRAARRGLRADGAEPLRLGPRLLRRRDGHARERARL